MRMLQEKDPLSGEPQAMPPVGLGVASEAPLPPWPRWDGLVLRALHGDR
jgi:hypothetical protein